MAAKLLTREYTAPLYSQADAARFVRQPRTTVNRWLKGWEGNGTRYDNVVEPAASGRGNTVSFTGLAELFVLSAFRKAGLPLVRIRPAVEVLRDELGLDHALASNRLVHDGAEILLKSGDPDDKRLIVVRNHQAVFNEVVDDYLQHIDFGEWGYAAAIRLPQFTGSHVAVRPTINGGRPTLATRGIAVDDVLGRIRAGEAPRDVADDFGLELSEVINLNYAAS